ncbi:MAG: signal peptide peptidase SppA, partial [Candidatus Nucleicultricaceae bacterium]
EFNMTPAHEEEIHVILNSIFDQMVNHMAKDRNLAPDALKRLFDSAPFYDPKEAIKVNLIDKIGYFYDLEDFIKEQHDPEAHFMSADNYGIHHKHSAKRTNQSIALIYASGEIIRGSQTLNPFGDERYISLDQIEKAFDAALKDPTTRAIVLRVNSPGGSPTASETISGHVKRAQKHGIPVIVSMSDVAGSGGYWISCYANKIVAQSTTITGSIGVIGGKIATEKFWNRFGVTFDGLDIGKSSSMWSLVKPYDADGWKKLQAWLDYIYDSFLSHVAAGRHLSLDHVKEIAKGRIWSGEDAKKFGLVDELGGLNKAIALAKSEARLSLADDVAIIEYPEEKSFLEKIASLASFEKASIRHMVNIICRFMAIFDRPGLKMAFDPEAIR